MTFFVFALKVWAAIGVGFVVAFVAWVVYNAIDERTMTASERMRRRMNSE